MLNQEIINERLDALAKKLKGYQRVQALINLSKMMNVKVYLVGGALRDAAIGSALADIDVAVASEALFFSENLAKHAGGTFVPLDEEHGSARVVFASGNSVDITDFRRPTLRRDCRARDLTCNALAADLEEFLEDGAKAVLDPGGSFEDLIKGVIRSYDPQNLVEDPLRMLRVFRYAATLGFAITPETLKVVRENAFGVKSVAAERVLNELVLIFRSRKASTVLPAMLNTGILAALFPFYSTQEISAWVGRATYIERTLAKSPPLPALDAAKGDLRNFLLVTMLAASKPGPRIADLVVALRLSKRITGRVMRVGMSLVSVRRLVNDHPIEEDFLYISARIALSLGEYRLAPWLIVASEDDEGRVLRLLARAEKLTLEKVLPIADSPPLVTGAELSERLDRAPGPWVSEVLERIFFRRLTGKVTTREAAFSFAEELVRQGSV